MWTITDLTRHYQRRPIARPNLAYYLWRFAANGARTCRALTTPAAFGDTRAVAQELTERGIVVGPSDAFLSDAGRRAYATTAATMLEASQSEPVRAIIAGTVTGDDKKVFRVDLVTHAIPADSPLLKMALDVKLLEIVSRYLGMWPALHSIGAWLNYPTDEPATSSQLWHHDPEDLKIIKVFIYLDEVREDNGPFTFIPGTHPFGAHVARADRRRKRDRERVADEQIASVMPPETWRVCTGPAGTMILADTLGYHRGGKPKAGTRLLVTFTYTSGTPLVDHAILIRGTPDWISHRIQRTAVRQLRIAPPDRPSRKGRKKADQNSV